jgi:hypothetical protein
MQKQMLTHRHWLVLSIARMPPPENWVIRSCSHIATKLARRGLLTLSPHRKGTVDGYDVRLTEAGQAALHGRQD